jgi:hypothetical protein
MRDSILGVPHKTFTVQSTDAAQAFGDLEGLSEITGVVNELFVGVETAAIRIACPEAPTQDGLGILFGAGDMFRVGNATAIRRMQFISAVAETHATLQIIALVN